MWLSQALIGVRSLQIRDTSDSRAGAAAATAPQALAGDASPQAGGKTSSTPVTAHEASPTGVQCHGGQVRASRPAPVSE